MNTRAEVEIVRQLCSHFSADEAAFSAGDDLSSPDRRIASAVAATEWRTLTEMPVDRVAGYLVVIFDACVNGHEDLEMLTRDVADCLRHFAEGRTSSEESIKLSLIHI